MKKQVFSLVVFLCCVFLTKAQNDALFEQGKVAYKEGNYTEAVHRWETILDAGEESAAVYYNLGNAYYKLNKVGPSIYYYEKALQLNPGDKDIKNNLQFAKNRTIDVIEPLPKSVFLRWHTSIASVFTLDGWAWFTVSMAILCVALFIVYYVSYATRYKRLFFTLSVLLFIVMLTSLSFSFSVQSSVKNNREAIIYKDQITIYDAPTANGKASFLLHEGTKVKVIDADTDWVRIQLADGKDGWVLLEQLKEL